MKNIFRRISAYVKANTKMFALYSALCVLIIILLIGLIGRWGSEKSSDSTKVDTQEVYKKINDLEVKRDKVNEINTLITEYYNALVAADIEKLSTLVDNPEIFNQNQLEQSIVESYNNLSCYSVEGLDKNSMVVFAYWEVKLLNTETLAPGIDTFYIVEDKDTKSYLIMKIGDEEASYINTIINNDEIKLLFEETNVKFEAAINADAQLKAVYDYFNEIEKQSKEKEEDATTTTTTETETTTETTTAAE